MLEQLGDADSKSGPVVLIGLDACDPATVQRMAAAGDLPNLAQLLADGSRAEVRNPFGLFVGALWVDFMTGVGPARHGFHCWEHIDSQDYGYRLTPPDINHPPFWTQLGAAGRRVALVDIPHSRFPDPVSGVAVSEWGCHDRHFGFHTQPPARCAEIDSRFGLHPILGIDPYAVRAFAPDDYACRAGQLRTDAENKALIEGLLTGLEAKTRMLEALLAEEKCDLFVGIYGESHAAGHQFWGFHDAGHPDFDSARQTTIGGDPIARVYRALDDGVGRLAEQLDPAATLFVLLSHGMDRHHDGTHLLSELLKRLDDAYRCGVADQSLSTRLRRTLQAARPAAKRTAEALRVPKHVAKAVARRLGDPGYGSAAERARQAFYIGPNNSVYGGIRFNLEGREAQGWVTPEQADGLAARLEADLKAMVNEATGKPIVHGLRRASDIYDRQPGDAMPDLFIDWARDAPIENVSSPLIGQVRVPYNGWRTGDHRPAGLLIVKGPGLPSGHTFPHVRMQDIPVSLAARLGVELADVEGEAAPWLAAPEAQCAEVTAGSERHS